MTTFVYNVDTPPQSEEEIYSSSSKEEITPAQRRGTAVRARMASHTERAVCEWTDGPFGQAEAWEQRRRVRHQANAWAQKVVKAHRAGSRLPTAPDPRPGQYWVL